MLLPGGGCRTPPQPPSPVSPAPISDTNKALSSIDEKYIDEALKMMGLDRTATGFKKDKIDDDYRLEIVQDSLHKPLELPALCDRIDKRWQDAKTLSDGLAIEIAHLGKWWAFTDTVATVAADFSLREVDDSPPELKLMLTRLLGAIYQSQSLLEKAFAGLSLQERQYLVKNILPHLLLKEDSSKDAFQTIAEKVEMRLAPPDAKPEQRGRDVIDPEEVAMLKLTLKINYEYLHQAGIVLASAVDDAITMLTTDEHRFTQTNGKDIVFYAETPYGTIIIGGAGDNVYDKDAVLIIDLGGNDRYLNRAGGAVGMNKPTVSIVIDLVGDDFYSSNKKFSQGSALFGIGILADLAGNDTYQAGHYSQGAAMFGIGILWDEGGHVGPPLQNCFDSFTADHFCQGAGGWGIGVLYNQSGDTRYFSRTFSQGLGYTLGAGALVDKSGDDYYIAAGTIQNDRPYSMSQGFGQGNRRIASGGVGTLIDCAGNDHYTACFYGQGCAYWYGLGLLIDNSGNDRYDAQVYAQGCGIHLSTGVLIDRGGSDFYNCTYGGNAQGAAHDLAVGILIDKNGRDTYVGMGNNQGSAITNSFALFIDEEGDDVYYTSKSGGQGYGGAARNYGSIGIFLDLGGNDFYSEESLNPGCGTRNNNKWTKGDKGAGIDTQK